MLCSLNTLYVGLQTRSDKAAMTINGISVVANVSTGIVSVGGESVGIVDGVPFTNATEKATRAQTAQMLTNFLRAN